MRFASMRFASKRFLTTKTTTGKMLRILLHTLRICQFLLFGLAFAACSGNDTSDDDSSLDPTQKRGTYLTLTISPDNASRTSRGPSGGEVTPSETALERESAVANATIFLYKADRGVNASADTPLLFALYAPKFTKATSSVENTDVAYTSDLLRSEKDIPSGTYRIIVVCNMGDLTSYTTLGDLRNVVCVQPFKQTTATDPSTASDFVMSSYSDITATLSGEGGVDHPVALSATVQRLAARLDFGPGKSTEYSEPLELETSDGEHHNLSRYYRYEVENQDGTKNGDVFLLTAVTPFNLLTSGTSLFKTTTTSTADDNRSLIYMGRETANTNGEATNYVVDPWTFSKLTATFPAGLTYATPYSTVADLTADQLLPLRETTVTSDEDLKYYILSYAQENTLTTDSPYETYATGIRVDGYYGKRTGNNTYSYSAKHYTHFIRHADLYNTTTTIPMKYGTVRNNIYRLYVNRVTSLGVVLIQVRDWRHINADEIQI